MPGFRRSILVVSAVGLLFSGGAAFTHGSAAKSPAKAVRSRAVTSKAVTPKLTTLERCASLAAGLDSAIARGPQTGPAHTALLNAKTLALHAAGCAVQPVLTTDTPLSVAAGTPVHDTATLSLGFSPTGPLAFTVFPGSDCTSSGPGTPVPPPVNVTGNGTYTSADFTPTTAGSYAWAAFYGGDANNQAAHSACEPFTVTGSATS